MQSKDQDTGSGHSNRPLVTFYIRGVTRGGVGNFISAILEHVSQTPQNYGLSIVCDSGFGQHVPSRFGISRARTRSRLLFDTFAGARLLKKQSPDVVVYPKNTIPVSHSHSRWKKVLVVHDLGYFEPTLNAYPVIDTLYMRAAIPAACTRADHILAVSEFTKRDLIERLSVPAHKVSVIGEGVAVRHPESSSDKVGSRPYFIYAGSLSPRKNLDRVFEAFAQASHVIPHDLYITGLKQWGSTSYLDKYPELKDRVHVLGYVPDSELATLYAHATGHLYPSLYEGFGLPILEAQALGCPVITSNVTACPETAGDGAYLVDPYSVPEIRDAILEIARNQNLREVLIQKGRENIERFSWHKSAQILLQTAHSLC